MNVLDEYRVIGKKSLVIGRDFKINYKIEFILSKDMDSTCKKGVTQTEISH